jgi:hypothetical protein
LFDLPRCMIFIIASDDLRLTFVGIIPATLSSLALSPPLRFPSQVPTWLAFASSGNNFRFCWIKLWHRMDS